MLTRFVTAGLALLAGSSAHAQELTLTLTEALRLASGNSEQVAIARAGVKRAEAEQIRARAQRLPQLNGVLSFTRTLASEFSGLFDQQDEPPCPPLQVNPDAPLEARVAELERALPCGTGRSPFGDAERLPFGRENIWQGGLSFSQPVYSGGRISAQARLAEALRRAADIQLSSANAQFVLEVTQAFYNTALAEALLAIAETNLDEATKTLEFVQLGYRVGRLPEFDVLRATVARRNQLPEIARRRAASQQSALRLKQLLDLPPSTEVRLESALMEPALPIPAPFVVQYQKTEPLRMVYERAPVREAEATVRQREASVRIARAQRLPSFNISSDYSLVAYPDGLFPTSTNQFRNNWTVGAAVQLPLFTGGRIRADILSAEANLEEARARQQQTRELALLDTSIALDQLQTAQEQWEAGAGTIDEATRAFDLARLRYREGISNQLEVDDARVSLLQARVERAQAARDLQVARATIALLPLLPLNALPQTPGQPQAPSRMPSPFTPQPPPGQIPLQTAGAAGGGGGQPAPRSAAGVGARSIP